MKVIDLLNKIANGELEKNTKFYDKYEHKEYIYKPKSYNGIYHEGIAYANENWYLTLKGSSRLLDEVEIIEDTPKEDKKIEYFDDYKINARCFDELVKSINLYIELNTNKINEIIDKIKGE